MYEKYDFSNIEDQNKFDQLSKDKKTEIVDNSYDEINKIREEAIRIIDKYHTIDYSNRSLSSLADLARKNEIPLNALLSPALQQKALQFMQKRIEALSTYNIRNTFYQNQDLFVTEITVLAQEAKIDNTNPIFENELFRQKILDSIDYLFEPYSSSSTIERDRKTYDRLIKPVIEYFDWASEYYESKKRDILNNRISVLKSLSDEESKHRTPYNSYNYRNYSNKLYAAVDNFSSVEQKYLGLQEQDMEYLRNSITPIMVSNIITGKDKGSIERTYSTEYSLYQDLKIQLSVPPEKEKMYALDALKALIVSGNFKKFIEVEKVFNINDSDFLQNDQFDSAFKQGIIIFLQKASFQEVDILKNIFSSHPSFNREILADSKVVESIETIMNSALSNGELEYALGIKEFCPHAKEGEILISPTDYIKWIPKFGNYQWMEDFPESVDKAKNLIISALVDDENLADYFIENLKNYCQQPWAAEGVEKAIKHYSVASKFVVAVTKNQDVWVNESWVNDILAKAQEVVAEHQKQWQQDGDEYVYGHGEGGFSESDPYKNHPWRFGNNQLELTTKIAKLLRNEDLQITSSGNGMKKKQERISVKNT